LLFPFAYYGLSNYTIFLEKSQPLFLDFFKIVWFQTGFRVFRREVASRMQRVIPDKTEKGLDKKEL